MCAAVRSIDVAEQGIVKFFTKGAEVPAAQVVTPKRFVVVFGLLAVPIVSVNSPFCVPSDGPEVVLSPTVPHPTGNSFTGAGCPTTPWFLLT